MGVDVSDWSGCLRRTVKISTTECLVVVSPLAFWGENRLTKPSLHDDAREGSSDIDSLRGEIAAGTVGGRG